MRLIKKFLFKYIHQQWNIAIAERNEDLSLKNIHWVDHSYHDRWFADPFIIDDTSDSWIVLVEEFMRDEQKGRLARLTISKKDYKITANDTILDLSTHLSFPNPIKIGNTTFVYPENGASGKTFYYVYGEQLTNPRLLSPFPLADAVMVCIKKQYYLLYTIGEECNGKSLHVAVAELPFGEYKHCHTITFTDNIARRAGNIFQWKGRLISPAQVCNHGYGEAVSMQEIIIEDNNIKLREVCRFNPPTKEYVDGFHTYNVYNRWVVIDGYKYRCPRLSRVYRKMRGLS